MGQWSEEHRTAGKAGQRADAMAARAYADGALRAADRNKDQLLTKTELADFFGG